MLESPIPLLSTQSIVDLGQIAALIWGAAKLHSTVEVVKGTADELKLSLKEVVREVNHHGERIARLEGREDGDDE